MFAVTQLVNKADYNELSTNGPRQIELICAVLNCYIWAFDCNIYKYLPYFMRCRCHGCSWDYILTNSTAPFV